MNLKEHLRLALFKIPIGDIPVRVRRGICVGAKWTLFPTTSYWRGKSNPLVDEAISKYGCSKDAVAWDVGAHFGYFTVAMARHGARVFAFKPSRYSYRKLVKHIMLNELSHARAFEIAVGDTNEKISFFEGAAGSSMSRAGRGGGEPGQQTSVQCVRLDDMVDRGEIMPPTFIKIDVEGYGTNVLRGGFNTICSCWPVILIGWHTVEEVHGARELLSNYYDLLDLKGNPIQWEHPGDDSILLPRDSRTD